MPVVEFLRICLTKWKQFILWALFGQFLFISYGGAPNWKTTIMGSLLGLFIGVSVAVNESTEKLRLNEFNKTVIVLVLGTVVGITIAQLLGFSVVGHLLCVGIFLFLGLMRHHIDEIF